MPKLSPSLQTTSPQIQTREFKSLCLDKAVELESEFILPLLEGTKVKGIDYTYEPTALITAVSQAARMLRRSPGKPLANLQIADLSPFAHDAPATYLANIINSSLQPTTTAGASYTSSSRKHTIAACYKAEGFFGWTIEDLKAFGSEAYPPRYGCDIVNDASGRPVFLRKSAGEAPSSLSLRPFSVNGVVYPAGSIAKVEIDQDHQQRDLQDYYDEPVDPYVPAKSLRTIPGSDITWVGFKRLSAFALPPEERSIFRQSLEFDRDYGGYDTVGGLLIEDIAEIATKACVMLDETSVNY